MTVAAVTMKVAMVMVAMILVVVTMVTVAVTVTVMAVMQWRWQPWLWGWMGPRVMAAVMLVGTVAMATVTMGHGCDDNGHDGAVVTVTMVFGDF